MYYAYSLKSKGNEEKKKLGYSINAIYITRWSFIYIICFSDKVDGLLQQRVNRLDYIYLGLKKKEVPNNWDCNGNGNLLDEGFSKWKANKHINSR